MLDNGPGVERDQAEFLSCLQRCLSTANHEEGRKWKEYLRAVRAKETPRVEELAAELLREDVGMEIWSRISLLTLLASRMHFEGNHEGASQRLGKTYILYQEASKYPVEGPQALTAQLFLTTYAAVLVHQSSFSLADRLINHALVVDDRDDYGHFLKGLILINANDAADALVSFTRSVELEPRRVGAWAWKGITESTLKDFRASAASWLEAHEVDPCFLTNDGQSMLAWVADAHYLAGDLVEATKYWNRAVAERPHELTYQHWVVALSENQRFEDLERVAEEAIRRQMASPHVLHRLGGYHFMMGDHRRGRTLLQALARERSAPAGLKESARRLLGRPHRNEERDSQQAKIMAAHAAQLYSAGDYLETIQAVERLLRLDRNLTLDDGESVLALACEAALSAGHDEQAVDLARRTVSRKPHHKSYDRLMVLLNEAGRHNECAEVGEQALKKEISCPFLLFQLGTAYFASGRSGDAAPILSRALAEPADLDAEMIDMAMHMIASAESMS